MVDNFDTRMCGLYDRILSRGVPCIDRKKIMDTETRNHIISGLGRGLGETGGLEFSDNRDQFPFTTFLIALAGIITAVVVTAMMFNMFSG